MVVQAYNPRKRYEGIKFKAIFSYTVESEASLGFMRACVVKKQTLEQILGKLPSALTWNMLFVSLAFTRLIYKMATPQTLCI